MKSQLKAELLNPTSQRVLEAFRIHEKNIIDTGHKLPRADRVVADILGLRAKWQNLGTLDKFVCGKRNAFARCRNCRYTFVVKPDLTLRHEAVLPCPQSTR